MRQVSLADLRAEQKAREASASEDVEELAASASGRGYVLPPLLWTRVKERLKPAEIPEFKRVLGEAQLQTNKELHKEASALAEIYTQYCHDSQISIQEVYAKRAAMPQPHANGLLLSEIAMLVEKLQATGPPPSSAVPAAAKIARRPSTPLAVKSIAQDRQQVLWQMLHKEGSGGRPGSADSPSSALRYRPLTSRRGVPEEGIDRMRLLFAGDARSPTTTGGGTASVSERGHSRERDSSGKRHHKKGEKKEKKRDKRGRKRHDKNDATLSGNTDTRPSALTVSTARSPLSPSPGVSCSSSSRDYFSSSVGSTGAGNLASLAYLPHGARPLSSQRPTSTASAPAEIDSPRRGRFPFDALNLPTLLASEGVAEFSLNMDDGAVIQLREALQDEVRIVGTAS
eukprot:INCI4016.2.p1 GENE.INCI4016.2~~INCI4016.2.p1  ORF type:complete len:399 (-),score=57.61 INCI4016.2:491-1687(-)